MKLLNLFAGAALALALGSIASGASAGSYEFNGAGVTAWLTTSDTLDAAGGYDVLSIEGAVAGFGSIDFLLPNPNPSNPFNANVGGGTILTGDNVYYAGDPHLDVDGLLFQLTSGLVVNLWGNSPGNYQSFVGNYLGGASGPATFTAVPEPATWVMMLSGVFGLGAVLRTARRRQMRTVSAA